VPRIAAIQYPKFPEEETCSSAQTEWNEVNLFTRSNF
jgi:hypothetical protein